jgi:hypothetical protein
VKFSEIIEQASSLLRSKGRLSYRTLKLEFDLSEEQLEVLKEELIEVQELALDKDGKMLVWKGESATASAPTNTLAQSQPPASYTPKHLADRILAEQAAMEARGSTLVFGNAFRSRERIIHIDESSGRRKDVPALLCVSFERNVNCVCDQRGLNLRNELELLPCELWIHFLPSFLCFCFLLCKIHTSSVCALSSVPIGLSHPPIRMPAKTTSAV